MKKIKVPLFGVFASICLIVAAALPAWAKRPAPPAIAPIESAGVVYTAHVVSQPCGTAGKIPGFMGLVTAMRKDQPSAEPVWKTALYLGSYECGLETDVQDVLIRAFTRDKARLLVTDERGTHYTLELKTGKLVKPAKSKVYPKAKHP